MRQFALLVTFLLVASIFPKHTLAEAYSASATLTSTLQKPQEASDIRIEALEKVFKKYDSPLTPYAKSYITAADKYGVDWKLLPAISGLESSFGRRLMPNSYNAYGWGGGYIYFENWDAGINHITKTLRANYMDKWGASDVWEIGPIYAESPTWSVRVNSFMNEINREYLSLSSKKALMPNL